MALETPGVPRLELEAVNGFNGHVPSGLKVHPDGGHLIYPLGNAVILKKIKDGKVEFLRGHSDDVSCISVSKNGSYIASGQVTFWGSKAAIIVWDYAQRAIYATLLLHKTKIEALAFSPNEKYLVSLGGQDDDSIVLWDIETKQFICRGPASLLSVSHCDTVQFFNTNNTMFVSAGIGTLQVWELDLHNRKIRPRECQIGKMKRAVKCVEISEDDQFIFCGTTSGDIMKVSLKMGLLKDYGPAKAKYGLGVNVLKILKSGDLLVGCGSGSLILCSGSTFTTLKEIRLEKGVTSIAPSGEGQQFFVGTAAAQMYSFSCEDFKAVVISTSHSSAIKDIAICCGTSKIYATCSKEEIRLWHIDKPTELLRIAIPNITCNSLDLMVNGSSIISAWNDGKIRMFAPETGRLMHIIHNAHKVGVTAIAGSRNCKRIISGGEDGQVCVWEPQPHGYQLLETMTKHKATITCIKIKSDDTECVTASSDGACIIWDIVRFVSLKMVIANTHFEAVCYHPGEYQIITTGTDRKVSYWDVYDGTIIRELQGSQSGTIHDMHISQDGKHFVTGGEDKLLKVWDYVKGVMTHIGIAHSGSINSVKVCYNNRTIISTSTDGAILRWRFPHPSSS